MKTRKPERKLRGQMDHLRVVDKGCSEKKYSKQNLNIFEKYICVQNCYKRLFLKFVK
jgi:hypothetical protein